MSNSDWHKGMPSPNPGGRPKEKAFRDALQYELGQAAGDRTKLQAVASALVDQAIAGDVLAINEVATRMDGKPDENVNMTHRGLTLADALRAISERDQAQRAPLSAAAAQLSGPVVGHA